MIDQGSFGSAAAHPQGEYHILQAVRPGGEISVCCFIPLSEVPLSLSLGLSWSPAWSLAWSLAWSRSGRSLARPWVYCSLGLFLMPFRGIVVDSSWGSTASLKERVLLYVCSLAIIVASPKPLRGEKSRASHEQIFPSAKRKTQADF